MIGDISENKISRFPFLAEKQCNQRPEFGTDGSDTRNEQIDVDTAAAEVSSTVWRALLPKRRLATDGLSGGEYGQLTGEPVGPSGMPRDWLEGWLQDQETFLVRRPSDAAVAPWAGLTYCS